MYARMDISYLLTMIVFYVILLAKLVRVLPNIAYHVTQIESFYNQQIFVSAKLKDTI